MTYVGVAVDEVGDLEPAAPVHWVEGYALGQVGQSLRLVAILGEHDAVQVLEPSLGAHMVTIWTSTTLLKPFLQETTYACKLLVDSLSAVVWSHHHLHLLILALLARHHLCIQCQEQGLLAELWNWLLWLWLLRILYWWSGTDG